MCIYIKSIVIICILEFRKLRFKFYLIYVNIFNLVSENIFLILVFCVFKNVRLLGMVFKI